MRSYDPHSADRLRLGVSAHTLDFFHKSLILLRRTGSARMADMRSYILSYQLINQLALPKDLQPFRNGELHVEFNYWKSCIIVPFRLVSISDSTKNAGEVFAVVRNSALAFSIPIPDFSAQSFTKRNQYGNETTNR